MATSTIVLVLVAVLVLFAAIAWVARRKRNQHRHLVAEKIRDAVKDDSLQVGQQEALADETAAKARAAQAEADVKAAEAAGLEQQAAVARHAAAMSREHLDTEWARADSIDPSTRTPVREDEETPDPVPVAK